MLIFIGIVSLAAFILLLRLCWRFCLRPLTSIDNLYFDFCPRLDLPVGRLN